MCAAEGREDKTKETQKQKQSKPDRLDGNKAKKKQRQSQTKLLNYAALLLRLSILHSPTLPLPLFYTLSVQLYASSLHNENEKEVEQR